MKLASLITSVFMAVMGIANYVIKNKVISLENAYRQMHLQVINLEESVHILESEWSYLTRPSRIQELLVRYQKLHLLEGFELVCFEDAGAIADNPGKSENRVFHASVRTR